MNLLLALLGQQLLRQELVVAANRLQLVSHLRQLLLQLGPFIIEGIKSTLHVEAAGYQVSVLVVQIVEKERHLLEKTDPLRGQRVAEVLEELVESRQLYEGDLWRVIGIDSLDELTQLSFKSLEHRLKQMVLVLISLPHLFRLLLVLRRL